eukprot:TRINITY_DN730_c0_g2_i1.p1 TRINITY_DN730_c0_g2~~TRINITY_DN730_c0_g2_i1.p1  ORF type:complete len:1556 (+),score=497.23 TRINITY_DN730_c0_g2_i1:92-4669(+)
MASGALPALPVHRPSQDRSAPPPAAAPCGASKLPPIGGAAATAGSTATPADAFLGAEAAGRLLLLAPKPAGYLVHHSRGSLSESGYIALTRYEEDLRDAYELERLEQQFRAQEERLRLRAHYSVDRARAIGRAQGGDLALLRRQDELVAKARQQELAERRQRELEQKQAEAERARASQAQLEQKRLDAIAEQAAEEARRHSEDAERINRREADRRERRRLERQQRDAEAERRWQAECGPGAGAPAAPEDPAEATRKMATQMEEEQIAALEKRLTEMMRPARQAADIRADRVRRGLPVGESFSPRHGLPPPRTSTIDPDERGSDLQSAASFAGPAPWSPAPSPRASVAPPAPPADERRPHLKPQPKRRGRVQSLRQQRKSVADRAMALQAFERAVMSLGVPVPAPLQAFFNVTPTAPPAGDDLEHLRRFLAGHPSLRDFPSLHMLGCVLDLSDQVDRAEGYGLECLRMSFAPTRRSLRIPGARPAPGDGTLALFHAAAQPGRRGEPYISEPLGWLSEAAGALAHSATASLLACRRTARGCALRLLLAIGRDAEAQYPSLLLLGPPSAAELAVEEAIAAARREAHYHSALSVFCSIPHRGIPTLRRLERELRTGSGILTCAVAAGGRLTAARGLLTLVAAEKLAADQWRERNTRRAGYGLDAIAVVDACPEQDVPPLPMSPQGVLSPRSQRRGLAAIADARQQQGAPLLYALGDQPVMRHRLITMLCGHEPHPWVYNYPCLPVRCSEIVFGLVAVEAHRYPNLRHLAGLCGDQDRRAARWPHGLSTGTWPRPPHRSVAEAVAAGAPRRRRRAWPGELSEELWPRRPVAEPLYFGPDPGDFCELCNDYDTPLFLRGHRWPTLEHYFQAQKFVGTKHEEEIREAPSAQLARDWGCERHRPLRRDWDQVKEQVMLEALKAKFDQFTRGAKVLLQSGRRPLVFRRMLGGYWGMYEGRGCNRLGKLLARVRRDLRCRQRVHGGVLASGSVLHEGTVPFLEQWGAVSKVQAEGLRKQAEERSEAEMKRRAKRMPKYLVVVSTEHPSASGCYVKGRTRHLRPTWNREKGGGRIYADERGYWCVAALGDTGEVQPVLESNEPLAGQAISPPGVAQWAAYDPVLERWRASGARIVEGFSPGDKVEVFGIGVAGLEGAEGEVVEQDDRTGKVMVEFEPPHGMLEMGPAHLCPSEIAEAPLALAPFAVGATEKVLHGGVLGEEGTRLLALHEGFMAPREPPPQLHGGVLADGSVLCEGILPTQDSFPFLQMASGIGGEPSLDTLMRAAQGAGPLDEGDLEPLPQPHEADQSGPLSTLRYLLRCVDAEGRVAPALSAAVLCGPGASLAKLMDTAGGAALQPRSLMVVCDARPYVAGVYEIGDLVHNKMPTWVCGKRARIYSDGVDWVIAGRRDAERAMVGVLSSAQGHGGQPPTRSDWLMYEDTQRDWIPCSAKVLEGHAPGSDVEVFGIPQLEGLRGRVVEQYLPDAAAAVEFAPPHGTATVPAECLRGNSGLSALCTVAGIDWGADYGAQLHGLLWR